MRSNTHMLWLMLLFAAAGCDGMTPSQPAGPGESGAPVEVPRAITRSTTSEAIAVTNLEAAIDDGRRRLNRAFDLEDAATLVEQLLLRADHYGTFDDWDEANAISALAVLSNPDDPTAHLLRARVLNTLHEFDEALAHVDDARALLDRGERALDAEMLELQARHLELTIGLALDETAEDLLDRRRALAAARPTYQHVTSLALALAQFGHFDEADAQFRRALEQYRDVSPFPFAWVAFQRGVMWSEQASRPDFGRKLYEEALAYLPGYVLVNVHLAELDALDGNINLAIERVLPLVGRTQDPEPLDLLADLHPSDASAKQLADAADAAYRALIVRFPEAFDHHAR